MSVFVIGKYEDNPYPNAVEVDTTSRGSFKDLSPFYLGPIQWYDPTWGMMFCRVFENMWQYSKLYPQHAQYISKDNYEPAHEHFTWREAGFMKHRADRYPMGKGAKPLCSLFMGKQLDYICARRMVYIPYYASLVRQTSSYKKLYDWVMAGHDIVLRDFDGYDHDSMGMSLAEVANNPKRSMGHAFVIKMLLTGSEALLTGV